VEKEFEANYALLNTTLACGSQSLIERQFQLQYTHAKFGEVQTNLWLRQTILSRVWLKRDVP